MLKIIKISCISKFCVLFSAYINYHTVCFLSIVVHEKVFGRKFNLFVVNSLVKKRDKKRKETELHMPRRGENIRKRKDGRWEGRYTVLTGREKKTYSVYARSYGEIKKKLAMKKETANSGYNDRDSFQETAGEWLQDICAKRKYSTYIKYQEIYSKYLSELNQLKMDELSQKVILNKLTLLNARDSKTLKNSVYSVLNQIIKYGNKRSGYDRPLFSWEKESAKKRRLKYLITANSTN